MSLLEQQDRRVKRELKILEEKRTKQKAAEYEDAAKAEEARESGNNAFRTGKYPEAVAYYNEAVRRSPKNVIVYSDRAAAYLKLAEFPMAMADCCNALELDPNHVRTHSLKAYCHFMMKEYFKAKECCTETLRLDPQNTEARSLLSNIGQVLARQRTQMPDEEQIARAMNDPEIVSILRDPCMQTILNEIQSSPSKLSEYCADPTIRSALEKLRYAGILSF
jgi:stress-induced-phosphoprotein 1